jgi:hypothetical protein
MNDIGSDMEKLNSVLPNLSSREVELLELRFNDEKTFQEIGFILNTSENRAKLNTYNLLGKISALMKCTHKIQNQNPAYILSQDEVISTMNFPFLWRIYNQKKTTFLKVLIEVYQVVDARILKRALRITGVLFIISIALPNQNATKKETVKVNTYKAPSSKNINPKKALIENLEKDLALQKRSSYN